AGLGAERVAAVGALEQEQVGAVDQRTLGTEIEEPSWRAPAIVEAATVRRIGADRPPPWHTSGGGGKDGHARQAGIGAALGAVAVHDMGRDRCGAAPYMHEGRNIARPDVPAHGYASNAKREVAPKRREHRPRLRTAGRGVGNKADPVAARSLTAREISHLP